MRKLLLILDGVSIAAHPYFRVFSRGPASGRTATLSARLKHSDIPPRPHHVGNMILRSDECDLVRRFCFFQ